MSYTPDSTETDQNTQTEGQYRVGYNDSEGKKLRKLKSKAAALIDEVSEQFTKLADQEDENGDRERAAETAKTAVETASMYAVKMVTDYAPSDSDDGDDGDDGDESDNDSPTFGV